MMLTSVPVKIKTVLENLRRSFEAMAGDGDGGGGGASERARASTGTSLIQWKGKNSMEGTDACVTGTLLRI